MPVQNYDGAEPTITFTAEELARSFAEQRLDEVDTCIALLEARGMLNAAAVLKAHKPTKLYQP